MEFLTSAWKSVFSNDPLIAKTFIVKEGGQIRSALTLFIDPEVSYDQLAELIKFHVARKGFQKIYFVNPVDFARTGLETPIEICQQTKQLRAILSYQEIPIYVSLT